MKLRRVVIKGYKHLKNISVDFCNESSVIGDFPVRFCIGRNGSGKSVFLEAIALIFSRAACGEVPGFWYEVEYSVYVKGKEVVVRFFPEHRIEGKKLCVCANGETYSDFDKIRELFPYKVIAYISGSNSQMEELMLASAKEAVLGDLYDLAQDEYHDWAIEQGISYLEELRKNVRSIFLDEHLAVLVLFALCVWTPGKGDEEYVRLREKIFGMLDGRFEPAAVSLLADPANMEEDLFGEFFQDDEEAKKRGTRQMYSWKSELDELVNAVFFIEESGKPEAEREKHRCYGVDAIRQKFANPLLLLMVLLQAQNEEAMRECHVFFRLEGSRELLNEKAFSDGELMWIARMGLVLLTRQWETDNCLFLLDEPDVHLNESWNVGFISFLKELSEISGQRLHHEFLVCTHSSLILTDALPEQLYLFERQKGAASVRSVPVSSFGADRSEISKMLFENRAVIGSYSGDTIDRILEEEDNPERLWHYIEETGPGIGRFQMLDKLYSKNRGQNYVFETEDEQL